MFYAHCFCRVYVIRFPLTSYMTALEMMAAEQVMSYEEFNELY